MSPTWEPTYLTLQGAVSSHFKKVYLFMTVAASFRLGSQKLNTMVIIP